MRMTGRTYVFACVVVLHVALVRILIGPDCGRNVMHHVTLQNPDERVSQRDRDMQVMHESEFYEDDYDNDHDICDI